MMGSWPCRASAMSSATRTRPSPGPALARAPWSRSAVDRICRGDLALVEGFLLLGQSFPRLCTDAS